MSATDHDLDWGKANPELQNWLRHTRRAVLFVAIIFGAIAALSFVGFLFNLMIKYPETDRPVIVVDPLWMIGHVIRGLGLGILTFHLCRYRASIKDWSGPSIDATEQFIKTQAAAWKAGAFVLGALLVYAVIYVKFGGPSL